jgi:hypothetical protein
MYSNPNAQNGDFRLSEARGMARQVATTTGKREYDGDNLASSTLVSSSISTKQCPIPAASVVPRKRTAGVGQCPKLLPNEIGASVENRRPNGQPAAKMKVSHPTNPCLATLKEEASADRKMSPDKSPDGRSLNSICSLESASPAVLVGSSTPLWAQRSLFGDDATLNMGDLALIDAPDTIESRDVTPGAAHSHLGSILRQLESNQSAVASSLFDHPEAPSNIFEKDWLAASVLNDLSRSPEPALKKSRLESSAGPQNSVEALLLGDDGCGGNVSLFSRVVGQSRLPINNNAR